VLADNHRGVIDMATTKKTTAKKAEPEAASDETISEKLNKATEKGLDIFDPITNTVRDIVLKFGEIILTVSIIIGLGNAVLQGLTTMGNVGFFSGISSMIEDMVKVIMSAIVIFLLFAIYKNTNK
jgi:hypothetical protein